MKFSEFCDWTTEVLIDAVITGGFRSLKTQVRFVMGQCALHSQKGWLPE